MYEAIVKDEIAQTLKQNAVTAEFFKDRVVEVIEASLSSEKEQRIGQLMREAAHLKEALAQASSNQGGGELDRARQRIKQIPLLQDKIRELQ